MLQLKSLNILSNYQSKIVRIIDSFYNPALFFANKYDRVSAYFDSKILELYAKGLGEFVYKNNGKIRFIFSELITEDDYLQMKTGYFSKIENQTLDKLKSLQDSKDISNLAFLVSCGVVEIKIAFSQPGILHDKFGLIYDDTDCIYFRGSNNETAASVLSNSESFETSCTWKQLETDKIAYAQKTFNRMWNNDFEGLYVIDIFEVIKNKIISFNKGVPSINYESLYGEKVIFDINHEMNLTCKDLTKDNVLNPQKFLYKRFFDSRVKQNDCNFSIFVEQKYHQIRKLISEIKEIGQKRGFETVVTTKLQNYLDYFEMYIEKRFKLGIAIKKRDPYLENAFNDFVKIVNANMTRLLRLPQIWDAFHISSMYSSANFSVPGAGKTSIVYGAFAYLSSKEVGLIDRVVVIGPLNSFMAWKEEFRACFWGKKALRLFSVNEVPSGSKTKKDSYIFEKANTSNVLLFNYEILPSMINTILNYFTGERTLLVFDEVHKIKNPSSIRAQAALQLSEKSKYKVVLTGTPIPNTYSDIYNLLNILYPNDYSTFFNFSISDFEKANKNQHLANKINETIYPFFCRTTKKDLDVPPPEKDDIETGLVVINKQFQKLFDIVWREFNSNSLLLYIRLMQASTNPNLIVRNLTTSDIKSVSYSDIDFDDNSGLMIDSEELFSIDKKVHLSQEEISFINNFGVTPKLEKGLHLLKSLVESGKQVVVWALFIDTIELITKELNKNGLNAISITGQMALPQREQKIKDFLNKSFNVIVTNPNTLAESISLHKVCHDAVYFEYSFNLTHMLQSRDRIHRLGLEENDKTNYYYLIADNMTDINNAIDLKTYNRLKQKEERMLSAIENKELVPLPEEYREDLDFILKTNKR